MPGDYNHDLEAPYKEIVTLVGDEREDPKAKDSAKKE